METQPATNHAQLVPVRLYLPAGDGYAKDEIRRWFRRNANHYVGYKEALDVSLNEHTKSNLVVLASRSSLPLLNKFQTTHDLGLRLTQKGISLGGQEFQDQFGTDGCCELARVVVTHWALDTQRVHTYIASNNTRAIHAVTQLLVSDSDGMKDISDALLTTEDRTIPRRFQLAFEVPLKMHETHANPPTLLAELNGKALHYR